MAKSLTEISKILLPFEARRLKIEERRNYGSQLLQGCESLKRQAVQERRDFAESVPSGEYKAAVDAVAAGTLDVRAMYIHGRAGEIDRLERQSILAADAAGAVLEEVSAAEQALAGEVAFALRPVWQTLTAELWQALSGFTAALDNIRVASDALNAAGFRGVNCPLALGCFRPLRVDIDGSATRWFAANETLGLVKPGFTRKAA